MNAGKNGEDELKTDGDCGAAARTSVLVDADLTRQVIGIFYDVYNELGAGFLESVYENAFCIALRDSGLAVAQQVPLAVRFRDTVVGEFRIDLLVEQRLIVEIKAVSQLSKAHEVQLVNYLKATRNTIGLLVNFGPHAQVKRRIFSPRRVHQEPSGHGGDLHPPNPNT